MVCIRAKQFIDSALASGGRVLVHCGDGISRSPAVVTAYVMCQLALPHDEAFAYVQQRRFCVSPNQGFHHQIEAYQHIWEAMQQAGSDSYLNQRSDDARRKRSSGMDDDEDDADAEQVAAEAGVDPTSGQRVIRNARRRLAPQEDSMQMDSSVILRLCFIQASTAGLIR